MKELGELYLDQVGIQNEDIRELAGILTQKQFSEKYHVDEDTLTSWKQKPVPKQYEDISWRNWLSELKPEIVRHVYTGLTETNSPAHAKFLLELEGEYVQKAEIKVDGTEELFEGMRKLVEQTNQNQEQE